MIKIRNEKFHAAIILSSFLMLSAVQAGWSATYYIDYNSGNDAANGTSKTTQWRRCPGMQSFGGSYSHSPGDQFIFKGGVTWPNACFRINVTNGGSSDVNRDYYGVDETWYTGGSWTRPIWDMQSAQTATYNQVMYFAANYITVDNIEVVNFYWSGTQAYGNSFMFSYVASQYITFRNLYIHSWTYANDYPTTHDDMKVFCGQTSAPFNTGVIIEYCEISGLPSGTDSGMAAYAGCPIFRFNKVHDMSNAIVIYGDRTFGTFKIYNNDIYRINGSFDSANHENAIEVGGPVECYNNIIHDMNTGAGNTVIIYLDPTMGSAPGFDLVYNNVVYGNQVGGIPLMVDDSLANRASSGEYVFNNTFVPTGSGTPSIRFANKGYGNLGSAIIQNNHFITDNISPITGTSFVNSCQADHNVQQPVASATTQGYVSSNQYRPTTAIGVTVGVGIPKSSIFTTDISGLARGTLWDVGAYAFQGVGAVLPPQGLRIK